MLDAFLIDIPTRSRRQTTFGPAAHSIVLALFVELLQNKYNKNYANKFSSWFASLLIPFGRFANISNNILSFLSVRSRKSNLLWLLQSHIWQNCVYKKRSREYWLSKQINSSHKSWFDATHLFGSPNVVRTNWIIFNLLLDEIDWVTISHSKIQSQLTLVIVIVIFMVSIQIKLFSKFNV